MKNYFLGLLVLLVLVVSVACSEETEETANAANEQEVENELINSETTNEEKMSNDQSIGEVTEVAEEEEVTEEVEEVTEEIKEEAEKEVTKEEKTSSETVSKEEDTSKKETSEPKPELVITTKESTSTESIGFNTIVEEDSSLEEGKTKVVQEGKNGVRTITYKETFEDGKRVSKEEVSSEVTTKPIDNIVKVGTKEPEPVASTISIDDLFQWQTASGLTAEQRLDAHNDTMENSRDGWYYVEQLNREFDKYIQGTFSWDYRNQNNKANYLAFRRSRDSYDGASMTTPEKYDRIHEKMKEHQLIITSSFNYSIEDIFIHPTRGGYTVSQVLRLKYTSDNGSRIEGMEPNKWYSVHYEVGFSFPGDQPSWELWNYGDYGWLAAGFEYRIGNFK